MILSELRRQILKDSQVFEGGIVSVDSFLNHQLNIEMCSQIGLALADQFRDINPTVVLTVEASGIVPAFLVAQNLGIRMIIARKKKSIVMGDRYVSTVSFSYTKNESIHLYLNKDYLNPTDRILIIDDFLANGNVTRGLMKLLTEQNIPVVGAGFVIEKSYLPGRAFLDEQKNMKTYSLVRIETIQNNRIFLKNEQ